MISIFLKNKFKWNFLSLSLSNALSSVKDWDYHSFILRVNFHTHRYVIVGYALILCSFSSLLLSHLLSLSHPLFSLSHILFTSPHSIIEYINGDGGMNKNVFIFQWEIFVLPFPASFLMLSWPRYIFLLLLTPEFLSFSPSYFWLHQYHRY